MAEETTTEAPVTTGAETAQPETTAPAEAVQEQTTEQPEQQTEQPAEPVQKEQASDDEQLADWAANKGLTLDSENAKKAAKMAREAEHAMHQKLQRASELEKNISTKSDEVAEEVAQQTGQDPEVLKRLQRMEIKEAVRDFWNTPDAKGNMPDRTLEADMVKLVNERPHLAGDLDALYATAMVQSGKIDAVKSQGKREALESLAQKQQAAVPTGNATNSGVTSSKKEFSDLSIPEMEAQLGYAKT